MGDFKYQDASIKMQDVGVRFSINRWMRHETPKHLNKGFGVF